MANRGGLFAHLVSWFGFPEQEGCNEIGASENIPAILASLPGKPMVVNDVAARYGKIDHLVIREDGAVFLIETKRQVGEITEENGELRHNGQRFENDLIRETTTNAFCLRELLQEALGIMPWINAAIVFPNASVLVPKTIFGVDIIGANFLPQWIAKARGNSEIAQLVMPGVVS